MHLDPWLLARWTLWGLTVVAIVAAVARARGVSGTLAWIFAIVALPGVGAVAYFLLANPYVRRVRRRKRQAAKALAPPSPGDQTFTAATEPSVLQLAARLSGLPPTQGNRIELLTDNAGAFGALETALREARRTIWAEYYIIQNDATGARFLDLLIERARAGVSVRLLYDAVGSYGLDSTRLTALSAAGGRARAFLPVNPLRRRWAVHLRNHRKLLVVDGEIGFTGGMNIGDEYAGGFQRAGGLPWRDTHIRLRGPAVGDLARTFAEDWAFSTNEHLSLPTTRPAAPDGECLVAVVPSGPDQDMNGASLAFFAGVASARTRCYVTSPYFVPDEPTLRALISTALRGVDVRVLVPRVSDVRLVLPAARSYYPALVRAGVRIWEYLPAILHAKTMVVDGAWGLVGSANFDARSFMLNFELGAVVHDRTFAEELERRFLADLGESAEMTSAALGRVGALEHLWRSTARLLSPLL